MRTTSKRHFQIFERGCLKWLRAMMLTNWVIHITHNTEPDDMELASTTFDCETKEAVINLNTTWCLEDPITADSLEQTALHEVCHILLAKLTQLAEKRTLQPGDIDTEEHEVIRNICMTLRK